MTHDASIEDRLDTAPTMTRPPEKRKLNIVISSYPDATRSAAATAAAVIVATVATAAATTASYDNKAKSVFGENQRGHP